MRRNTLIQIFMNRIKAISCFSALILALFVLGEFCIGAFFPEYSSAARYIIPIFYWVLYFVAIIMMRPLDVASAPKYIMAFKAAKIFLSLMLLAIIAFVFRSQAIGVIVNFLAFSMVMLVAETVAMLYIKRHSK